jgi:hypothetical protein
VGVWRVADYQEGISRPTRPLPARALRSLAPSLARRGGGRGRAPPGRGEAARPRPPRAPALTHAPGKRHPGCAPQLCALWLFEARGVPQPSRPAALVPQGTAPSLSPRPLRSAGRPPTTSSRPWIPAGAEGASRLWHPRPRRRPPGCAPDPTSRCPSPDGDEWIPFGEKGEIKQEQLGGSEMRMVSPVSYFHAASTSPSLLVSKTLPLQKNPSPFLICPHLWLCFIESQSNSHGSSDSTCDGT